MFFSETFFDRCAKFKLVCWTIDKSLVSIFLMHVKGNFMHYINIMFLLKCFAHSVVWNFFVCQSVLLLFVFVALIVLAIFLRFAQVRGLADQRWSNSLTLMAWHTWEQACTLHHLIVCDPNTNRCRPEMSGLWNFSVRVKSWSDKIESDPVLIRKIFENC